MLKAQTRDLQEVLQNTFCLGFHSKELQSIAKEKVQLEPVVKHLKLVSRLKKSLHVWMLDCLMIDRLYGPYSMVPWSIVHLSWIHRIDHLKSTTRASRAHSPIYAPFASWDYCWSAFWSIVVTLIQIEFVFSEAPLVCVGVWTSSLQQWTMTMQ